VAGAASTWNGSTESINSLTSAPRYSTAPDVPGDRLNTLAERNARATRSMLSRRNVLQYLS
jgi:hypothetical protein